MEIYIVPINKIKISSDIIKKLSSDIVSSYRLDLDLDNNNVMLEDFSGRRLDFENIPNNKAVLFSIANNKIATLYKSENINDIDDEYLFLEDYWSNDKSVLMEFAQKWKDAGYYFIIEGLNEGDWNQKIMILISAEIAKLTNGFILIDSNNLGFIEPGVYSWQKIHKLV